MRHSSHTRFGVLGLVLLLVTACHTAGAGDDPGGSAGTSSGSVKVVTTTTVFADIVRAIAGDRASVASIIPAGAGPEDYESRPNDARRLADADLVISNGVGLDDFVDKLITAAGEGAPKRVVLGDGITPLLVDGEPNPHFWMDPSLVIDRYIPAITAALTQVDPAGAAAYSANAAAYVTQIRAMDEANKARIATIPAASRKLVTFHDAFPYFAAHYGFDLVGVILPNVGQEPSPSDLAALVDTVKASGVKAVFAEGQFSPKLAETLAQEAGITRVVSTLYTDSVGPPPHDTYLSMMRWNVDQVVEALS